jgi:hypothetical protein
MWASPSFRASANAEWAGDELVAEVFVETTYVGGRVIESEQKLVVGVAKWCYDSNGQEKDVGHVYAVGCRFQ